MPEADLQSLGALIAIRSIIGARHQRRVDIDAFRGSLVRARTERKMISNNPPENEDRVLDEDVLSAVCDFRALHHHELHHVSGGRGPTVFKPSFPPVGR